MKRAATIAIMLLLASGLSSASIIPPTTPDDVIRVLVVRGGGLSDAAVNFRVNHLVGTWVASDTPFIGPSIAINIVNQNAPIPLPYTGGDIDTLLTTVDVLVNAPIPGTVHSLRSQFAADVVIAFTADQLTVPNLPPGAVLCGGVNALGGPLPGGVPWIGTPPTGFQASGLYQLDRRGSATGYIVIASMNFFNCMGEIGIASHEFGHLLGAGHYAPGGPTFEWLFTDSRAEHGPTSTIIWFGQPQLSRERSVVADPGSSVGEGCESVPNVFLCVAIERFSDATFLGNPARHNARTIGRTARSVANYWQGPPQIVPAQCNDGMDNDGDALVDSADPDCTGTGDDDETSGTAPPPGGTGCLPHQSVPTNLSARLVATCIQTPGGLGDGYNLKWQHGCAAGRYFEVWANTAGIGLYKVLETNIEGANVSVTGPPSTSTVQVRACTLALGSCSALSTPPVPIVDTC